MTNRIVKKIRCLIGKHSPSKRWVPKDERDNLYDMVVECMWCGKREVI
jgi:hypothetical protein